MSRNTTMAIAALILFGALGVGIYQWRQPEPAGTPSTVQSGIATPAGAGLPQAKSPYLKLTDPSISWQLRVDMLRQMKAADLSSDDVEVLYSLLHHQPSSNHANSWWGVVNEIMEQMRLQGIAPERYGKELLAIICQPDAHMVLRDYAIQHLGLWVSPKGRAIGLPSEENPEIIRETAETFAGLIKDPHLAHGTVPGTALAVLIEMQGGGVDPELMQATLADLESWFAATISGSNSVGRVTRISAINAIGMLGMEQFRPEVRAIATDETADPSLRLNSIATLGQIGESSDLQSLEAIAANDRRLHYAARAAIKKLSAKLQ